MQDTAIDISYLQDPKFYLENFCKIKTKSQGLAPFILNEAQKDLFNVLRKKNRVLILKARQLGFCQDPRTKILTTDLRWVPLDEIEVGQSLVAVDEYAPGGKGRGRKMRDTVVEAKWDVSEPAFLLKMGDGRELVATAGHRYLSKVRGASSRDGATHGTVWRSVSDFKIGDSIRSITRPWGGGDFEDGWFSGMIDGEGSFAKKSRTGAQLCIAQIEGAVLERLRRYVVADSLTFREEVDRRLPEKSSKFGEKPVYKIVLSKMDELFRVMGKLRPSRLFGSSWWDGKELPNDGWQKIVSIESLGVRRMIDLQTSVKTFIAEGFVSHNSTAITGYAYHYAITHPGVNVALVGYNSDLTKELLDKVKTFYRTTPEPMRPTIQYNSKFEISFPKLESKIMVLPSTETVGRGYTINFALLTEAAWWENAEEKVSILESSVPLDGTIVMETTPNSVGDYFYRTWKADNGYEKKEYGWWWGYTEDEVKQIAIHMNDPRRFAREYSLDFSASGRVVFDPDSIRRARLNLLRVGDKAANGEIVTREEGVMIFHRPVRDGLYVLGADVAEGVDGGDYSVFSIFDRATGEEVAFYRGHMAPDKFAEKIDKWGRYFNNALAVVEINNHGLTTVTRMKQLFYPSMYYRPAKFESAGSPWSDKLGWRTTRVTRPLMIDDLVQAIRDGDLTIHSEHTLDEMLTFIYNKHNDMEAQSSAHDDCIFSAALSLQGFKILYQGSLDQLDYTAHLPSVSAY